MSVTFGRLRGLNSAEPMTSLSDDVASDLFNVLLEPQAIGRRRPSTVAVSLSSGPTGRIDQLVRHQPLIAKTGAGGGELWAFSEDDLFRLANGTWSNQAASDTVTAFTSSRPYGATFNGKFFLTYDSDVNRLHVWDGTSVRRVGIEASAAATVANTGAGAYAATIRYYKIQWKIISGANVIATSELSPVVSFTPSGAGTAARITKPTTPDSSTHWVVFGSADNVTFYNISGNIAVGTTTYDDSAAPSAYSSGEVAPSVGLYVPPPWAPYILATDNRIFLAGGANSTGTSTQTAPKNSRVWFTSVLGSLDNTGEDEAIRQTVDTKHWIDLGENDGDAITGLGGPVDGAIFVFKDRSTWRIVATGNPDDPYRAECLSEVIGATWQDGIALGEDGNGNPAVYFQSLTGPKRIANGFGIEDMGADVRSYTGASYSSVDDTPVLVWDSVRRIVWWLTYAGLGAYAFQPQFEQRTADGVRGGWTRHSLTAGGDENLAATCYEVSGVLVPYISGRLVFSGAGYISSMSGNARRDVGSDTHLLNPTATSKIYQPGGPLQRVGFQHPVVEWQYPGAATAPSVTLTSAIGGPLAVTGSVTDTATSATYSQSVIQEKLESIQLSDVFGLQIAVAWDAAVDGTERPRIHGVTVPIRGQEGA